MDLVKLYTIELMERVSARNKEIEKINKLTEGHIAKNSSEEHVDLDSFSKEEKTEYEISNMMKWINILKIQLLKEYIRENSGMEFGTDFLISTEELIQKVQNMSSIEEFLSDYKTATTNIYVIEIMGRAHSNRIFVGKTPEEIKEIYFNMITQSMIKNGFTQGQIDECVNMIAVKMGGREKTSSLNK